MFVRENISNLYYLINTKDMNQEQTSKGPVWGFVSPDGKFQSITSLTTINLEYASRSVEELQQMINEFIATEEYEKCAVIRDEITRRARTN